MMLRIIFSLGSKESVKHMVEFLGTSLNKVYTFKAEGGEVMVGFGQNARPPTMDDAWKVALWIKNNCGLNPKFVIEGRDENDKPVYLSTCELCREGKHEHGG